MAETPSNEPWSRRPRPPKGDKTPHQLFYNVGAALTQWETIEGEISIVYIALLQPSKDYKLDKYFRTVSFERRHTIISAAIKANVRNKNCGDFTGFIDTVLNYSPRRHEIAHGCVADLGEYGFYLAPTNTLARNYPGGAAVYQYNAEDVKFYYDRFTILARLASDFVKQLASGQSTVDQR